MESSSQPTSDERILAGIAHASILLSFLGPVIPAVLWTTQRRKSQYVAFHALQAMGYQILLFWCGVLFGLLVAVIFTAVVFILAFLTQNQPGYPVDFIFIGRFILVLVLFGIWGIFILIGVLGGVLCLTGRDFRYPYLGNRLWIYLTGGQTTDPAIAEDEEDNWVLGMCHASAILLMWGIFLPIIIWLTQKGRSVRLRYQSLQALVYQGIGSGIYIFGMALYFVGVFALMFLVIGGGMLSSSPSQASNSPASFLVLIFLIFFFIIMLFLLILLLLIPIYHLFAFIAAVRVIRGHDYQYPVLGKWLAGRLAVR